MQRNNTATEYPSNRIKMVKLWTRKQTSHSFWNDDRFALMVVKEASTELQFFFSSSAGKSSLCEVHILHAGIKWNPIFITYFIITHLFIRCYKKFIIITFRIDACWNVWNLLFLLYIFCDKYYPLLKFFLTIRAWLG